MSLDSIPQVSLGTAALVIFALCVGFVMLRGIVRMLIHLLILGGSAILAWYVWRNAPVWMFEASGKSPDWAAPALAATSFLAAWWLLGKIIRFFTRPGDSSGGKPKSFIGALLGLLFSLVPTALLTLIAAVFFHHSDSTNGASSQGSKSPASTGSSPTSLVTKLTGWLEETIPKDWLEKLDPLASNARVQLAKTITAQATTPRATVIDPQTGKPYPRAVIVQSPELQNLAREGKFSKLLHHPDLTKALADPKVQKLLHDLKP